MKKWLRPAPKKVKYFLYVELDLGNSKIIANFEIFHWNISLSATSLLFLYSEYNFYFSLFPKYRNSWTTCDSWFHQVWSIQEFGEQTQRFGGFSKQVFYSWNEKNIENSSQHFNQTAKWIRNSNTNKQETESTFHIFRWWRRYIYKKSWNNNMISTKKISYFFLNSNL